MPNMLVGVRRELENVPVSAGRDEGREGGEDRIDVARGRACVLGTTTCRRQHGMQRRFTWLGNDAPVVIARHGEIE
jgi:hypothetical protein